MRLIIVANRAPLRRTANGWEPSVGGLSTALLPVLEREGGVWVASAEEDGLPERHGYPEDDPAFEVRRLPLTEEETEHYYNGMSNSVIWPISHYMLQHLEPRREYRDAYRRVNVRFAHAVLEEIEDDAVVWVQDYHLMAVPELVRDGRPDATIGFFWHIPWPAVEVFRIVPGARDLLRGMLGSDLIGFHIDEYVENFLNCASRLLGAEVEGNRIHWNGREVRVASHPIGVDVERFRRMSDEVAGEAETLRAELGSEHVVVGIDRLDYTKGVLSRLLAFERLLEENPDLAGQVTLFQVATPSRAVVESYQQLKREVDEAVGRINGAFAQDRWVPIHYRYRSYTQRELCVFYRAADVALITPLRDGMNLVTQEFVAATRDGVLVLSELTGAAHVLPEALGVNPYDEDSLVAALGEALRMPREERLARLERLKERVRELDVHPWANGFLASLAHASASTPATPSA
ncbi:MAG TPA: trehalose-6-phosphate synthase [Longimicrobiales bacterium]|nr:trehalose-6-phosphate synthase [Longimicrobiales bacterium]